MHTRLADYLLLILSMQKLDAGLGGLLFLPYQTLYQITSPHGYHESSIRHAVNDLERLKYIEKLNREEGMFLTITKRGVQYIKERFQHVLHDPVVVDGKSWWQVIFDVPERKREIRDQLRNHLQQLGFKHWQDSVYLFPADSEWDGPLKKALQQTPWPGYFYLLKISEIAFGINGKLLSQLLWQSDDKKNPVLTLSADSSDVLSLLKKKAINSYQRTAALKKSQILAKKIFNYFDDMPTFPVYFTTQNTHLQLVKAFGELIRALSAA